MTSPVTVTANGLTISHKGSTGWVRNTTPDVCRSPSAPVPYSIISYSRDLVRGSRTVFSDGGHSISVKGSAYATCTGDEPGTGLGVISNTQLHEATWITYSPNITIENRNICRKTDKMFMNNKNCISGVGGDYEPPLGLDRLEQILCKIFCEAADEFEKCKQANGGSSKGCKHPSKLAEEKFNKNAKAQDLIRDKYGQGAKGVAEKPFVKTPSQELDNLTKEAAAEGKKPPRKIMPRAELESRLRSSIGNAIKRAGVKKVGSLAARSWMKLVPILNVASTIYDVVDTAWTIKQLYDEVAPRIAESLGRGVEVKPDLVIEGPNGEVKDVYDWKFEGDRYRNAQDAEFKELNNGNDPKTIDEKKCQCNKKKGAPPATS